MSFTQTSSPAATVRLPFASKKVEDLLLWRDVRASGAVFATVTLLRVGMWFTQTTIAVALLYMGAVAVMGTLVWAQAGGMISRSGPGVPDMLKQGINEMQANQFLTTVRGPINKGMETLVLLWSGKNAKLSLQVAAALYAAARLFKVLSLATLLYSVFFLAFTIPFAYALRKTEIDLVLMNAQRSCSHQYAKLKTAILSKIPRAPKSATVHVE